uniref:Uncharacterized protein n=1 Tax=Arundo donax TaxID=35708 RepID=A0A0A9GK34_ARUDO
MLYIMPRPGKEARKQFESSELNKKINMLLVPHYQFIRINDKSYHSEMLSKYHFVICISQDTTINLLADKIVDFIQNPITTLEA